MPSEIYRSEAGSEVKVSGKHMGIVEIDFDWFEEGACCDAEPSFENDDRKNPGIMATCECCEPLWIPVKIDALDSLAS